MISTTDARILDSLISEVPVDIKLENQYFTESEIRSYAADPKEFNFPSFKRFLDTRRKSWCGVCDNPFSLCGHSESERTQQTVYVLDGTAVCSSLVQTIEQSGPISNIQEKNTIDGDYAVDADFGNERISLHFFFNKSTSQNADVRPLELEFPVLLREFGVFENLEHCFSWRDLLSNRFRKTLSEVVSSVRNATAATFAVYDEDFVYDHRTELRSSIRDYFRRSGFTPHDEIATYCPEISDYGIDASYADFVCTLDGDQDEKILVSHGDLRDSGWYVQRFVDSKLTSVEDEPVYVDLQEQIEEKVTYYKALENQLGPTPRLLRGVAAFAAVLVTILTATSLQPLSGFVRELSPVTVPNWLFPSMLIVNFAIVAILSIMLISPFLRAKLFKWDMYSAGTPRPWSDILQHSEYRIK